MDVSIIIVNYNTRQLTENCIRSVLEYTHDIEYEVILVDNASTDGSVELFAEMPGITFVASKENLGFGRANNLGFEHASGEYIFLLNSDTLLLNNAVQEFFVSAAEAPQNVACFGAYLLGVDKKTNIHSYANFPSIGSLWRSLCKIYLRLPRASCSIEERDGLIVDYTTGADLFIRRSVIEELGMFDQGFFMYFEETELQYRYQLSGYCSMLVRGPKIVHLENGSDLEAKTYSFRSRQMYFESMKLYMRKRYTGAKYVVARVLMFFYVPLILKENFLKREKLSLIWLMMNPAKGGC